MAEDSGSAYSAEDNNKVYDKMRLAAEAARFGVWDYDPVNDILEWDDWMHKIFGTSPDTVKVNLETFTSLIHPDDRARTIKEQNETIAGRDSYTTRFRIIRPGGEVRYIKASAVVVRDTEKNPRRVTGIITDITERKKAEERMSKLTHCMLGFGSNKDQNINCLVMLSGELFGATCALYYKLDGDVLCAAEQWNTPPGFKPSDSSEGHICNEIINSDSDEPVVLNDLEKTKYFRTDPNVSAYGLKTYIGVPIKCNKNKLGSLCVVYTEEFHPTPEELDFLKILGNAIGNQEERKADELRLREREADLKAIIENSLESIWSIDRNYRIKYVNEVFSKSFYDTFGTMLAEGVNILESLPENLRELWKERYDRTFDNEHFTFIDKIVFGGATIYIEVAMNPIVVDGKVKGASFYGKNITEKMFSEEILRESEAKYRQVFENANDAILLMSKDIIIDCNKKSLEMFGCQRDDIIGSEPYSFSPREQADRRNSKEKALELIQKVLEGTPQRFEWIHMRRDGSTFEAEVSLSHFPGLGEEMWIQAIIRDITYRKHVEEALMKSEANMITIIENTLENIWSVNRNYEIQYLNKSFAHTFSRIFGVELVKGTNILKAMPEKSRPVWVKRFERALRNERMVYEDTLDSGTKIYHAEISVNPIVINNRVEGASLYARNITDKKNAELQLQYQSELRKLLIELSNSFINLPLDSIDPAIKQSLARIGEFVGADRAYIFDYNFTEQTGTNTYEWCRDRVSPCIEMLQSVPMDQFRVWVEAHRKGETIKVEKVSELPRGGLRELMESQDVMSLLTIPLILNGQAIGFVGFDSVREIHSYSDHEEQLLQVYAQMLVNLRERLEKEEKLIAAKVQAEESNRLKTAFLQNMSHEIRTPMNAILGFLGLLREPEIKGDLREDYVDIVDISGQRLLATINDIIEISKIEAGQAEVIYSDVNISEMMRFHHDLFKLAADKKKLSFTISEKIPSSISVIRTDKHKFESILTNLINNAIKFTHHGSVEFGNYVEDDYLVFYVKDTGVGVPVHRLDAIFDRFVQADVSSTRPYEGSGLGLSIAKAYIELLKGEIWVDSEVNKGSTFFFSVPIVRSGSQVSPARPKRNFSRNPLNGPTILIAEDDDTSFMYLQKILEKSGASILRAISGEDTIKAVREKAEISLVLMDVKMPGMDGLEATWQIRQFNKTVPIIAQTAYALTGDRDNAIKAGCNDYLSKPIKSTDLLRLAERYIGKGFR